MSFGAIARSRILLDKAGTTVAVQKWWKKSRPALGEITQQINANEQHILIPWIKTFPNKMMDRAPTYMYPITAASLIYLSVYMIQTTDHAEDVTHRF